MATKSTTPSESATKSTRKTSTPVSPSTRAIPAKGTPQVLAARTLSPKPATKAQVLSSKVSYKGKVFSVTTDTVTEPGGVTSTRDVIQHNGSVVILAIGSHANPVTGSPEPTVLIERQYRHAAGKFLLELPAGRIEPGEAPLAAAKRELIEETGFRAKKWSRLVRYYASPGFLAEHMQVFLAEDIREGLAQPEEDEKIELRHVPLADLLVMIHAGKIEDAKTMLAVLIYAARLHSSQTAKSAVTEC